LAAVTGVTRLLPAGGGRLEEPLRRWPLSAFNLPDHAVHADRPTGVLWWADAWQDGTATPVQWHDPLGGSSTMPASCMTAWTHLRAAVQG